MTKEQKALWKENLDAAERYLIPLLKLQKIEHIDDGKLEMKTKIIFEYEKLIKFMARFAITRFVEIVKEVKVEVK